MELHLLQDIVIIFALSTLVNLLFIRLKVPGVVGYLLTGMIAGPHLLGLISDEHNIELLAEIGVILLLFTIGMEFSLKHLLKIRRIVFLGGFIQVLFTAGTFFLASRVYGLDRQGALFMGFVAALSSSALVLKLLQERSELTSNYGRTVVGILIFQDIMLVPLLLFTNLMGTGADNLTREILLLMVKAAFIIGLVYAGNKWILPRLLHLIAMSRSEELFLISIILICLSVALLTSSLGMSLAFGAFLAGLMISDSDYSHNAFGNLIPFKDVFTSFFFVSIGMLFDISFIAENWAFVILSVTLVVLVKSFIAGATGFILGHTFKGTVLVGLALSQVGEFSFILAGIGRGFELISAYYYQLFIAVAVITMALTPFFVRLAVPLADTLLKLPLPEFIVKGLFPLPEVQIPDMNNHLVIIGKDTSALKLSVMANLNHIPHVSVIFDPHIARERMRSDDRVVYGDAVNEPVLLKAHVDTADVVVVSIGSMVPSLAVIDKVRRLNKNVWIVARTKHIQHVGDLYKQGADQVLAEKLEIGIDLFNRVLIRKLYPQKEVNRILSYIRSLNLGDFTEKDVVNQPSILDEFPNLNIVAVKVEEGSEINGKSLKEIQLRNRTGATLLAIRRDNDIIEHPKPDTVFEVNDVAYILGNPEQENRAFELFSGP
ncbi:MAG: cation:proton antiporter [Bacteroidales bacterium]|nr:cation:proton antiporter [Bacteroidales bacterium]